MIKRKLLKIGLILTLSFTLLTGCGNKDNTTAKVDTSTTIEEDTSTKLLVNNSTEKNSTSEKESESTTEEETTTEIETTTEVETQKVAEAETTQPATEAPIGSFDNPINDDTPKETEKNTESSTQTTQSPPKPTGNTEEEWKANRKAYLAWVEAWYDNWLNERLNNPVYPDFTGWKEVEKEQYITNYKDNLLAEHNKAKQWIAAYAKLVDSWGMATDDDLNKADYEWAVKKVAEWKVINPDPAYLIGMFECYARSNWCYDGAGIGGKWKHAMSYYGSGVCSDIETCFHTFCDVAGIPCERIEDWSVEGGHTWDRVTIDGVQYEVDMTKAISVPESGQFESLVASLNTHYYGNDEFPASRFCSVLGLKPNYK